MQGKYSPLPGSVRAAWAGSRSQEKVKPERVQKSCRKEQGGHRHDTGHLRPSRAVPCHVAEQQQKCHKSQFVCQPGTRRAQLCKQTSVLSPCFSCLMFSFFLAVIPALPVSWKIPRKCCADSFKESDQSVNLLLFVIKRECLNLYRNYTVHRIMGSAAFHSEVDTGLQTFLHEHLDVLG